MNNMGNPGNKSMNFSEDISDPTLTSATPRILHGFFINSFSIKVVLH